MALALNDRVQQTGTANTTVSFTLSGSVTGFQSFAVVGNGNTTYYTATDVSGNWEVGVGTYATGGTLTRTTILASSNTGSAVTFSGTVNVFVTYPAEKSVNQDANNNVNILTNVPNTTTTIGTLNVGDGTYSYAQLGQLATFASAEPIVNTVSIQNTSTSNTAYSSIQVGANNYNTGYYIELGTNSSTYSYSAAGYPNSSVNQPNVNYIVANKADLGIVTWDANNIHFIQNASTDTVDSMTLFYDGGTSLGGYGNPGLGSMAGNKFVPGFTSVTSATGTTILTAASTYYQRLVGTAIQTIQLPDATTCLVGTTFIFDNDSTGILTITDGATGAIDTIPSGGIDYIYLISNGTVAGTWSRYALLPSSYDFSATSAGFGGAAISNAVWNGTTIASGYGGTGLTTFAAANNALYSTSAGALAAGTLPIAAGGTASTTLAANNVLLGNGTSALQVVAPSTSGNVLTSNGTTWASTALPAGGVTVTNDTTTATALYPTFTSATTGSILGLSVTSTKYTFVPSTGTFTVPNVVASNGLVVNNKTVSTSFTIPTGYNATATGPMTIASGAVVTIPSGSRWMIL